MTVVLFPFQPDWASAYEETFVYNSKILRAADGSEQAISIWGNRPRRNTEYTITLTNNQAQMLDNLLFAWQGKLMGVPLCSDVSPLTADAAAAATVINLDTTMRSFVVGGSLTLWRAPDDHSTHEIVSLTFSSVTITPALPESFARATRVFPIYAGLIGASLTGKRLSDQHIRIPVAFESEPSQTPFNTPVGVAAATYRGEELYIHYTNWVDGVGFNYSSDIEITDYNVGKVRSHTASSYSPRQQDHSWLIKSRSNAVAIRAWLGRREGRARPVYMPSGLTDFTLKTPYTAGDAYLDVASNYYNELVILHPARKDILIQVRGGTYYARRITGSSTPTPGTTRLVLDTTIPVALLPSTVKRISFLSLYRQVSDSSTIRWRTDSVGTLDLDLLPLRAP